MKKFYVACFCALLVFVQIVSAQTYKAVFSGNWSDASIWDINGTPSNPCSNCTVTINDGVQVTLDISFTLSGNSRLFIGSSGAFASSLLIPATNATNIASGHNLILSGVGGGLPTVKIVSAVSSLAFTQGPGTSGKYDGLFIKNPPDFTYTKELGIAPSQIGSDGVSIEANTSTTYGTSLPSSAHPAPFTINSDGTLPIVLTDFEAVLTKEGVNLSWITDLEENSSHFEVEHSADASTWQTIGTVAAKGFSEVAVHYSFTDQSPLSGANYYRLKMVDIDGRYKYSDIEVVRGSATSGYSVYPNPARDFVNISVGNNISGDISIRLINQFGQVLQQRRVSNPAGTTVSLQLSAYPEGNYILQVIGADGTSRTSKVLITR